MRMLALALALVCSCQGKQEPPIPKAPPPPDGCEIVFHEVTNLRAGSAGDFSQATDPTLGGRLFIDTTEEWDGQALVEAQQDKQRAKLVVEVIRPRPVPEELAIFWEVFDPDDPASHGDVDASDDGRDNTGRAFEGNPNRRTGWLGQADHELLAFERRIRPLRGDLIGTARTRVVAGPGGAARTSVFLYFSDDGGDNFSVTATLEVGDSRCQAATGLMTVWRKRFVEVYAMAQPGGSGNFYPGDDRDEIESSLRAVYAEAPDDQLPYIDFAVADASGAPARTLSCVHDASLTTAEIAAYALDHTDYHPGQDHADNQYQMIGVDELTSSDPNLLVLGSAESAPHAFIAIGGLATAQDPNNFGAVQQRANTRNHEIGHALFADEGRARFHDNNHSRSAVPQPFSGGEWPCLGRRAGAPRKLPLWCPKHASLLRDRISRAWSPHDSATTPVYASEGDSEASR